MSRTMAPLLRALDEAGSCRRRCLTHRKQEEGKGRPRTVGAVADVEAALDDSLHKSSGCSTPNLTSKYQAAGSNLPVHGTRIFLLLPIFYSLLFPRLDASRLRWPRIR
jgi:hypothetical protein